MHETTQFRLVIKGVQDLPLTDDFDLCDLVEVFTGSIVAHDLDTGDDTEIGWGSFYRVRLDVAVNCGLNAFDACDAFSHDLHEYAVAVLDPETGDIREDLYEQFNLPPNDLLILHMLEVMPAFRGWNLGLLAVQQIIEYYAQAVVLLRPQPLQFLHDAARREYHDQMEYSSFLAPEEAAKQKIREYWAKLGFQPLDEDFMILDSTLRRNKITLARLGPSSPMA